MNNNNNLMKNKNFLIKKYKIKAMKHKLILKIIYYLKKKLKNYKIF